MLDIGATQKWIPGWDPEGDAEVTDTVETANSWWARHLLGIMASSDHYNDERGSPRREVPPGLRAAFVEGEISTKAPDLKGVLGPWPVGRHSLIGHQPGRQHFLFRPAITLVVSAILDRAGQAVGCAGRDGGARGRGARGGRARGGSARGRRTAAAPAGGGSWRCGHASGGGRGRGGRRGRRASGRRAVISA